jgi:hypothetical protein
MDGIVKVKDGHIFETDEDGDMVHHDMGSGYHDGPRCLICQQYWCMHCNPEIFGEVCEGRLEPTLDGLEWRQPQGKIVGRRKGYDANLATIRRLPR